MVYPRTKVHQRRRDVVSLLVRGVPPCEIAEVLGQKRETIYNDVRVIRSGRYDALVAHTRDEIIAQLYLNAQERVRCLWRIVDDAQKEYVKVIAMRELRLNDERVIKKLTAAREMGESREDDEEKKEMLAQLVHYKEQFDAFKERVELLKRRRLGLESMVREQLESGDEEGLREFLSAGSEPPAQE